MLPLKRVTLVTSNENLRKLAIIDEITKIEYYHVTLRAKTHFT